MEVEMVRQIWLLVVILALVLGGCAPVTPAQEVAMAEQSEAMADEAKDEMMDDMDADKEAMMEEEADKSDAMMKAEDEEMMKDEGDEMMKDEDQDKAGEMMEKEGEAMMMTYPDWFGVALTDVRTMGSFTIADLKGKVILVEALAMWCPKCKQQQEEVKALHMALGGRDDFVSLGLDIDPNENASDLKVYSEQNGFDWVYAIAPAEVTRELGALYGAQFLNPTATPMLIIDRQGEVHPLPFGIKSAAELLSALEPFLAEEM
jgi:thiol-disulfide isomerase/thioredoxin